MTGADRIQPRVKPGPASTEDDLITGNELVVRLLESHGVETIFALSGNGVLGLFDAALGSGLAIVDTRDESAAVQAAGGRALATRSPQVAIVTEGPGFANALPGIAAMNHDGIPVVVISNCEADDLFGTGSFQEMPQIEMAAPIAKWSVKVRAIEHLPDVIARAFRVAASGVPGVVVITIASQVLLGRTRAAAADRRALGSTRDTHEAGPPEGFSRSLLGLLKAARRPLMIVGSAARWDRADEALRLFVESTRIPVATCDLARGLIGDDHPCSLGEGRPTFLPPMAREADVVFVLGERIDYLLAFGRAWKKDTAFIQVYPDVSELARSIDVVLSSTASTRLVLESANAELAGEIWPEAEWLSSNRCVYLQRRTEAAIIPAPSAEGVHPSAVAAMACEAAGAEATYVVDGANCSLWIKHFLPFNHADRQLEWGRLGMIGMGLPYALGVKSVRRDKPVVLLTGDGSLGFHFMEFETAVRHDLRVVIVICNDAGWGIERHFQRVAFGRETGTTLTPVRYDLMATALGGFGAYVESVAEMKAALDRAMTSGLPAVINVRTINAPHPVVLRVAESLKAKHGR